MHHWFRATLSPYQSPRGHRALDAWQLCSRLPKECDAPPVFRRRQQQKRGKERSVIHRPGADRPAKRRSARRTKEPAETQLSLRMRKQQRQRRTRKPPRQCLSKNVLRPRQHPEDSAPNNMEKSSWHLRARRPKSQFRPHGGTQRLCYLRPIWTRHSEMWD